MPDDRDDRDDRDPLLEVPSVSARESTDVSEETLHRIADAAGDLYARFGVRRVSIADVARAAKVSKATVYRYVSGKRSLLELYAARESGKMLLEAASRASGGPGTEAFVSAATQVIIAIREHPVFAKVAADEPEVIAETLVDPTLAGHMVAIVDMLAPVAEAAGIAAPRTSVEAVLRLGLTILLLPPTDAAGGDLVGSVAALIRPQLRPKEQT